VPKPRPERRTALRKSLRLSQVAKGAFDLAGRVFQTTWIAAKWLFGTLFGLLIVVATLFGLIVVKPNVVVLPPTESTDFQRPFFAAFVITNQSPLPIFSVTAECTHVGVRGHAALPQAASTKNPYVFNAKARLLAFSIDEMSSQESQTFECDEFKDFTVNNQSLPVSLCILHMVVKMRAFRIFPWTSEFDFVGKAGDDKRIHWNYAPMPEVHSARVGD
jgi:hypothetical protein